MGSEHPYGDAPTRRQQNEAVMQNEPHVGCRTSRFGVRCGAAGLRGCGNCSAEQSEPRLPPPGAEQHFALSLPRVPPRALGCGWRCGAAQQKERLWAVVPLWSRSGVPWGCAEHRPHRGHGRSRGACREPG